MNSNIPDEEKHKVNLLLASSLILIFLFFTTGLLILSSCSDMPDAIKAADDIFDDAIKITVDKSALQQHTDLNVNIEIKNKDSKVSY